MKLNLHDDAYEIAGIPEDPSPLMITFAVSDIMFLDEAFKEVASQRPWYDNIEICQLKHSSEFFKEKVVTATVFFSEADKWYGKLKELSQIPVTFIAMSARLKTNSRLIFASASGSYVIQVIDENDELIASQKTETEIDDNLLNRLALSNVLQKIATEFRKS